MILTTSGGRRISVTSEPLPSLGRVVYRVAKVGAFTLEADPHAYPDPDRATLRCTYGVYDFDGYHGGDDVLPEAPVLFGIEVCGGAVFNPDRFDEQVSPIDGRTWRWPLPARRNLGRNRSTRVPDGTAHRITDIVGALVVDYLARPDRPALDHAHQVLHATTRLAGHQRTIGGLRDQIAKLQAELDTEMRLADIQAGLVRPAPIPAAT